MKKNLLIAGAMALCMAISVESALACDHDKASASAMNGTCGAKSSMTSLFKEAPGTRTEFRKVDNGVALVVMASSRQYVATVQNAIMQHMDQMKMMAGEKAAGTCPYHSEASMQKTSSGTCPHGADKASMSSGSCAHSADKASMEKTSGASCCATKGAASKASMTSADCPDWMKVLCTADMKVDKTANGVMITWTSPKKDMVEQLRAAGEKFQAEISQL